jgi:hypothetical protein
VRGCFVGWCVDPAVPTHHRIGGAQCEHWSRPCDGEAQRVGVPCRGASGLNTHRCHCRGPDDGACDTQARDRHSQRISAASGQRQGRQRRRQIVGGEFRCMSTMALDPRHYFALSLSLSLLLARLLTSLLPLLLDSLIACLSACLTLSALVCVGMSL